MLRYCATPLGARRCAGARGSSSRFTHVSFCCPEQREAAWIGLVLRFLWLERGRAGAVSTYGEVVLLSFFWWWRGGIFGVFHCLVASFLRILGSVLVLGSGSGICRSQLVKSTRGLRRCIHAELASVSRTNKSCPTMTVPSIANSSSILPAL